ncbi:hypothetical protein D5272_12530 [bacterium D16-76]|nr:hypothetical protein [bacterium D16-76]
MLAGGLLALTLAGCGGGEGTSSVGTLAESAQSSLEDAESELEVMTVEETVEHFKQLSPQVLGLEGQRVSEYDVYNQQASVPVDGIPCLELTVYDKNATDTNTPLGTYLYARDGTALYELDVETDTLTRLELA